MDRDKLLKELTELDFMAIDFQLYLDTHPNDMKALEKFNMVTDESKKLKMQYEKKYGPLFSRSEQEQNYDWINDPWPWQAKANFNLDMEDK